MSGDDERPEDVLGPALWGALGALEDPALPDDLEGGFRARLAEEEGREVLGAPLWEALGALPEVAEPSWSRPANRAPWRALISVAAVAAAVFVLMPALRRATTPPAAPPPPIALAMARDLELVEHLDLLADPDFELILQWDGEAP